MSGTRFARAGRWRLFMCLGALILMLGMIALFHNQQELDEKRDQRLRTLNEQLQSIIEQKYQLERNHENERMEQLESRHNLEQKLKGIEEQETKEQVRYEKLLQSQKSLQTKYNELEGECNKNKKEQQKHENTLEQDLQNSRAELQKLKNSQIDEIKMWQEKYNAEKDRLEVLLNAADTKGHLQERINELEKALEQCQSQCELKPNDPQPIQQIKKPPHLVNETRIVKSFSTQVAVSPGLYEIAVKETNKTQLGVATNILNASVVPTAALNAIDVKSTAGGLNVFGVGDGLGVGILSVDDAAADAALTKSMTTDRSLILMSVENFQILPKSINKLSDETETQLQQQPDENSVIGRKMVSPLSAPRKPSSTKATKLEQNMLESNVGALQKKSTNSSGISSTSSSLTPLQLPPNQRKLPANVAPIPDNFDELLKNDVNAHDGEKNQQKVAGADIGDIDAAMEDIQKHDNNHNDANNNRYANAVDDMEAHAHNEQKAAAGNEDSGAHEIRDNDVDNERNFNLGSVGAGAGAGALIGGAGPAEDGDGNFFDGAAAVGAGKHHEENDADDVRVKMKNEDNEDDDMLGVGGADTGDIAVKSNNHLLDGENLNNEVAGDQGKEFAGDGLRLEDGNEEDEDEDDYSNLAARQQGAQAIRN